MVCRALSGSTGYIFAVFEGHRHVVRNAYTYAGTVNDGTVQAKLTADVNLRRGAGTNTASSRSSAPAPPLRSRTRRTASGHKVKLSDGTRAICSPNI